MAEISTAPHLEECELLHLVDGDASNFELDRWTKHVLGCADCSARLNVIRGHAETVSRRLQEVQLPDGFRLPELPATHRAARVVPRHVAPANAWMRAAVLVGLIAAPLVLVQPLRAWVAENLSAGWDALSGLFEDRAPAMTPPDVQPIGSARILFGFERRELTIELASAQSSGALVVRPSNDAEGSLEVIAGDGETPLLYEGGIRIANAPTSTASYDLRLPDTVEILMVRIGGSAEQRIPVDDLQGEVRLDL